MDIKNCDICRYAKLDKPLYQTRYWRVVIATDDQKLLGKCYVSLKRHCESLSQIEPAEWNDLRKLIKKLETSFKKTFGATMFNWNCYMNDAYQVKPSHPHIHWHFRPRYNHKVTFAGMTFYDKDFGHASVGEKRKVSEKNLELISNKIKMALQLD